MVGVSSFDLFNMIPGKTMENLRWRFLFYKEAGWNQGESVIFLWNSVRACPQLV